MGFSVSFVFLRDRRHTFVTRHLTSTVEVSILRLRQHQSTTATMTLIHWLGNGRCHDAVESTKSLGTVHIALCLSTMEELDDKREKLGLFFLFFFTRWFMHCVQRVKRDFGQVV